jgi:eukaryotic-like serine/threonine-protein kinase
MELLKAGQIFAGRYRVERFLANGGMGAVFIGEHTGTDRRVAIKVLWPQVLGSRDAVEKFQLEARVAGRVRSEHIVTVLDAGFDDASQMPFLVMELLDGTDLEKLVERQGPLDANTAVAYLRQVASGLDKAHAFRDKDGAQRPIVHRDLKPENLFLTHRDSGEPLVKILDFGIAKVLGDATKASQDIKGTPLFMAYEQASGGRATPQTDIWALGLITYFLLTGKYYWRAANVPESGLQALFAEVLTLPFEPPSARASIFGARVIWGPEFDAWFLRCLSRDPTQRFATAGAAVGALAGALDVALPPRSIQMSGSDLSPLSTSDPLGATEIHTGAAPAPVRAASGTLPSGAHTGTMSRTVTGSGARRSSATWVVAAGATALAIAGSILFLRKTDHQPAALAPAEPAVTARATAIPPDPPRPPPASAPTANAETPPPIPSAATAETSRPNPNAITAPTTAPHPVARPPKKSDPPAPAPRPEATTTSKPKPAKSHDLYEER